MTTFSMILLGICVGVLCTSSQANRQKVQPHLPVAGLHVKRSRNVPSIAPKVRQKLIHGQSTLRRRVALVTKIGATLSGAQQVATHATSLAPPYQGGPSLFSTRMVRTSTTVSPTSTVTTSPVATTPTATTSPTTGGVPTTVPSTPPTTTATVPSTSTSLGTSTTNNPSSSSSSTTLTSSTGSTSTSGSVTVTSTTIPTSTTALVSSTSSTSTSSSTTATSTETPTSSTTSGTTTIDCSCGILAFYACDTPPPPCGGCGVSSTTCRSAAGTDCEAIYGYAFCCL